MLVDGFAGSSGDTAQWVAEGLVMLGLAALFFVVLRWVITLAIVSAHRRIWENAQKVQQQAEQARVEQERVVQAQQQHAQAYAQWEAQQRQNVAHRGA